MDPKTFWDLTRCTRVELDGLAGKCIQVALVAEIGSIHQIEHFAAFVREVRRLRTLPTSPAEPINLLFALTEVDQIDRVYDCLVGKGTLSNSDAVRIAARGLREKGLLSFKALRENGQTYQGVRRLILYGLRQAYFDRPLKNHIRAIKTTADSFTKEDWDICLFNVLDGQLRSPEETIREAASRAAELFGLQFQRLPQDGKIWTGFADAIRRGIRNQRIVRNKKFIRAG